MTKFFIIFLATTTNILTVAQSQSPLFDNIGEIYYQSQQGGDSLLNFSSERSAQTKWIINDDGYGGSVPTDICYIEELNKIYVYGKRNVIAYNAITHSEISIVEDFSVNSRYSQFYPTVEGTSYLNYNNFAYNPNNGILYCVVENDDIIAINTTNDVSYPFFSLNICGQLGYYNHFIKYDNRLNRIYYAFSSQSSNYIYALDANDGTSFGHISFDDPEGGKNNIRGLEINDNENELYVSVNKNFYRITFDPNESFTSSSELHTIGSAYNSIDAAGNLLYLKNEGKLFCFPNSNDEVEYLNYYILNISDKTVATQQCPPKVTAACFDGNNKVYIAYESDNNEPDLRKIDIGNYSYGNDINTHDPAIDDINITMDLDFIGNKLLIAKSSEVTTFDPVNSTVSSFQTARNNYFSRIAAIPEEEEAFTINTWGASVDIFNTNGQVDNTIDIGGIAFHACYNPTYHKIYFYNKHIQDKSKVYAYDTETGTFTIIDIDGSISDIEVHPKDHTTLVSTLNSSHFIKVIQDDQLLGENNWIELNHGYISELFVSPSQKLFSVSSVEEGNEDPGLEIGELTTTGYNYISYEEISAEYPLVGYFTVNMENGVGGDPTYVYAAITDNDSDVSKLLKINDQSGTVLYDHEITLKPIDIDYNAACDYIYIAHQDENNTVTTLRCRDDLFSTVNLPNQIMDIESNSTNNFVYVLHANALNTQKVISKISFSTISNYPVNDLSFYCSSMKYNPDNSMLYVHVPFTDDGCSFTFGGIYEIYDEDYGYPAIKFFSNEDAHRLRYLGTSTIPLHHDIILDLDSHMLYYAGGGHSDINQLEMSTYYQLQLRYPYTWLSVPRHQRTTTPDLTPTSTVFAQENITHGYTYLNLDYNEIEPGPPYTDNIVYARWENPNWTYYDGLMENIHSARGYILTLEQETPPMTQQALTMEGTVQDPATRFALYCNENNWIGYFLYQNQSVFWALGDYEPYIYHIMHQDFTCYRYNFPVSYECDNKSTADYPPGTWICNKAPNIKYGDMIIVKPTRDLPEFSWSLSHFTSSLTRPDVEYYVVEEKATYATLVIELDTTQELPQEIGAFVNDTCVGAGSVVEGDSVIVLQAYLGDHPGDSLVFEEHYNAKSTADRKVDEYLVLNPESRIKERRAIKTGEEGNVHIISFGKSEKNNEESLAGITLDLYPNPASGQVTIEYILDREGSITIDVFDKLGRKVKSVNGLQQSKGTYTMQWNLTNNSGHRLAPGVYLVRLASGNRSVSRKVMVQ